MAEERVFFESGPFKLEALLGERRGERAAVVCAPHPFYGGNLRDAVVEAVVAAYGSHGFTTLRFNWRGIGDSEGTPDDGAGALEDARAAIAFLEARGKRRVDIAGYSFGAWISFCLARSAVALERAVLVAPPVDVALCDFSGRCERIGLVVGASDDHFAGAESVKRLAAQWNPAAEIRIIPESNHYLMLETGELTAVVAGYLAVAERSAGAAQ